MARRYFSNITGTGTLSGAIGTSDTSVATTGFTSTPTTPFPAVIDRGLAAEECVLVTANAGGTLTVQRGYDGTAASSHSAGAVIEHAIIAEGPNKWDAHVEQTSGMHGVTGEIVGTTATQTVTDKTHQESVYEAQNTTSPGSGPLFAATVDNTSRTGFEADTTGIAASGKALVVVQSGSDRFRVNADGSVLLAPSGTPTWAADITGNQRITGGQTVTGTSTVGALSSSGAVSGATLDASGNVTIGGTLGITGSTTAADITSSGNVTAVDLIANDDLTVADDATITGTVSAEDGKVGTATVSGSHARVDTTTPVAGGSAARSLRQPITRYSVAVPDVATAWDTYTPVIGDFSWTQTETGNISLHLVIIGQTESVQNVAGYGVESDMKIRLATATDTVLEEQSGWRFHTFEFAGSFRPTCQAVITLAPEDILTAGTDYKFELMGDRITGGVIRSTITALVWTVTEVARV